MRGEGLTKAMVQALPETGAFVVVHSVAMRAYVRSMVRSVRGDAVADRCRFIVVSQPCHLNELVGASLPIRVDHAVEDCLPVSLVGQIQSICDASNARFPS